MVLLNYYQNMYDSSIIMDYLSPDVVDMDFKNKITQKGNSLYEFGYKGKKMRQVKPIMYAIKLYKLLKEEHYDAIHVHGSSSMMVLELFIGKLAGVKIRIAHSHNTKSDNEKMNRLFKCLFNRLYTDAFACGEDAGKWLFGDSSSFVIIPNGKDLNLYKYNQIKRKEYRNLYHLNNKIVIGHVGNFNDQKNHEYLLNIFNELNDDKYCLLLVGGGELQEKIVSLAKKMCIQNRIVFAGSVSSEKVAEIIQAMDIIVFPSKYEGFPNVLIEWQISGLPCLISDKITEAVKLTDLVKFLPIDKSPKIWAEEIKKTKIIDRKKDNLSIQRKVKEAGYDIKENAKKLENLYLDLKRKRLDEKN